MIKIVIKNMSKIVINNMSRIVIKNLLFFIILQLVMIKDFNVGDYKYIYLKINKNMQYLFLL